MTTTAGKWFEIDSKKGQVYLVGAATRELAFEYHDKGYIALEANLGFEDGKTISFSQGGNTVTATDDENGFSEDDIGKYIYTGDGWHKILSVSDVTIVGCGKNLLKPPGDATVSGVTYTLQDNGTYLANGTVAGTGLLSLYKGVLPAGQYTISGGAGGIQVSLSVHKADGTYIRTICASHNGASATGTVTELTGEEAYHLAIIQAVSAMVGQTVTNVVLSPQLEAGDTATAFEAYEDVPLLALDNAQGQIESVAVEAGCRAKQAGTGDPSPENIRAITGRESVEIAACGKNLLDPQYKTFTKHTGGQANVYWGHPDSFNGIYIPAGKSYTISLQNTPKAAAIYVRRWVDREELVYIYGVTTFTFSLEKSEIVYFEYYYSEISAPTSADGLNFQLELGSTATAYEPYTPMGGGTVTPTEPLYGLPGAEDTVEVSTDGDVLVTRRTAVLELDGTEDFVKTDTTSGNWRFEIAVPDAAFVSNAIKSKIICSHYKTDTANNVWSGMQSTICTVSGGHIAVVDMRYDTVGAWKAYLAAQYAAGTPVTIVYELAAPETETPADVAPIEPNTGEVNVFTDADSLNITLYKTENNKYASVTGSFSQTKNGFASMLAQMNEISISGEDVELTKLEIDYVPQVR